MEKERAGRVRDRLQLPRLKPESIRKASDNKTGIPTGRADTRQPNLVSRAQKNGYY